MEIGQFTVIKGAKKQLTQVFLLADKEYFLGRSSLCHFRLFDPLVSSLHCAIETRNRKFLIRDLLSANGLFVNNSLVNIATIKEKDRLKIGKTILEFSIFQEKQSGKTYIKGKEPELAPDDTEPDQEKPQQNCEHPPLGRLIKNSQDLIICRLAVKNKIMNHEQISDAIELQRSKAREGKDHSLTDILFMKKLLSEPQIKNFLQEHKYFKLRNKDITFGHLVVEQQLAREKEVKECLQLQEKYFEETKELQRLGEILVRKSYLSVKDNNRLIKVLSEYHRQEME